MLSKEENDTRPVLFVTNYVPPARVKPFETLSKAQNVEFLLFGGKLQHAGGYTKELPFSHSYSSQSSVYHAASSGRYRAVICGSNGRTAIPGAYFGAKKAGIPFILWATMWAHPRTPAHLLSYPLMLWLYRKSSAVVTYGPHVSRYVASHGAKKIFTAPQCVDNEYWSTKVVPNERQAPFQILAVGRPVPEKGIDTLLEAWKIADLPVAESSLVVVGPDHPTTATAQNIHFVGKKKSAELRNFYASSDVLVIPSKKTRTFLEPWGLTVNEAMNQSLPVVASDAVGAAAGGLVRDRQNGLIFPAGNSEVLAKHLVQLFHSKPTLKKLGQSAKVSVANYTPQNWSKGMVGALNYVESSF